MASMTDKAMQGKPGSKDIWLTHSFQRGAGSLAGRITPAGERLFYFRYTDSTGKRSLLPVGPYHPKGATGLTLAQAFDRGAELSALCRSGVRDLREHFKQQAEEQRQALEAAHLATLEAERAATEAAAALARRHTVRTLFAAWQRAELAPKEQADGTRNGRRDGGEWVRQSFERRVFPILGDRRAEDVRRSDLLGIIDEAKAGGTLRTAQVLLADLRQMFRFAAEREIVDRNPLDGIKASKATGRATERNRALSDAELQALASAMPLARMAPRSMLAVWLILATGVRVGECMGAAWATPGMDHAALATIADKVRAKFGVINVAACTWHLPTTKNERAHTIHLSDFAMRQVEALLALRETDDDGRPLPWVFPATDRTQPVCVKSFGKQLADRQRPPEARMANRSKATHALALPGGRWTAHDLRRTAATVMARLGVSTDVIDECLNHKLQSKVARVYIHDRREEEQARAFDALGRRLAKLVEGSADAADNVVKLEKWAA